MQNLLDLAKRFLKGAMVLTLALMVLMVFFNVILRYFFNSGLELTEELGRYLFVWLIFLGVISAFARGTHIRVDSIVRLLPIHLQKIADILGDILMLICTTLIFMGCIRLMILNWDNLLPISEIPVGVLYMAGIPCSFCVGFMLIERLIKKLAGKFPAAIKVTEGENK